MSSFDALIRFVDSNGQTQHGNIAPYSPQSQIVGSEVEVLSGNIADGFTKTGKSAIVKSVRNDAFFMRTSNTNLFCSC